MGATLSAAFIMAANSWMQHPVGYQINADTGRPELTSIGAPVHQPGVRLGLHARDPRVAGDREPGHALGLRLAPAAREEPRGCSCARRSSSLGVLLPVSILILLVGSHLGVIETTYQPMKVAAMEAQWETCRRAPSRRPRSAAGPADETRPRSSRSRTCCRSWPPGTWDGQVVGINELQAQYEQQYGPGDYIPNLFIQYWSMRVMAYLGSVLPILALWGASCGGGARLLESARVFLWVAHLGRPDAVRR